jgi:HEAT repeat protein
MIVEPQSRSIIPRALQSRAARVLRVALQRIPPRVQRLGLRVLTPVMKRWPTVLELLGLAPGRPPRSASPVPSAARPRQASDERGITMALTTALRHHNAEVAAEAADALRHHPNEIAISALRGVVENVDRYFSPGVRAAAIRTLSAILPRGEGAPIVAAISDLDAEVSVAAIAGVVDRNESGGADALLSVLENPKGYYVALTRGAAARGLKGLAAVPDPARLGALIDAEGDRDIKELLRALVALS